MVWGWPTMPKRGADQGMHRGLEAERGRVGGNVMHPSIGDQESAGDAIDGNV